MYQKERHGSRIIMHSRVGLRAHTIKTDGFGDGPYFGLFRSLFCIRVCVCVLCVAFRCRPKNQQHAQAYRQPKYYILQRRYTFHRMPK